MRLDTALRAGAMNHPAKPALLVGDRSWTYGELDTAVDRMAAGLAVFGIQAGDRVALHFANGADVVCSYYACFRLGAIAVPLNTRMKGPELAYVLNHSGARVYLGQRELFPEIDTVRGTIDTVEHYFVGGATATSEHVSALETLGRDPGGQVPVLPIDDEAVAVVLYTSGTTAKPKGVTHTHATLGRLADIGLALAEATPDDITGIVLPACHIFGLAMVVSTIRAGSTAVMIPRFDAELVLHQLQTHGVTIFGALPVMLNAIVNHPAASHTPLPRLRVCLAGGDAVPTELLRRFRDVFGVDITEACGMTEINPYTCNPLYGRGKPGSIGRPAPGVTIRLVDEFGHDVAAGQEGEVLVRTDALMIGYWNDPGATAATIADGWLRTGDLARVDDDGYYWFVGRKKEIIIRGGSNISPLEVEEVLYQHPAVREVGVVGCPDPGLGEIVLAFVALRSGTTATEDELKQFVGARLAAYKVPERITFVPELPKGLTGKVQRRALKQWAAAG